MFFDIRKNCAKKMLVVYILNISSELTSCQHNLNHAYPLQSIQIIFSFLTALKLKFSVCSPDKNKLRYGHTFAFQFISPIPFSIPKHGTVSYFPCTAFFPFFFKLISFRVTLYDKVFTSCKYVIIQFSLIVPSQNQIEIVFLLVPQFTIRIC